MRADDRTNGTSAVADNIRSITELEAAARRELTLSERVSTAVTDFAGSLFYVMLHVAVFGSWAIWNVLAPVQLRFDPFPFGLLTMLVSLEGVFLATFVLITQNRIMARSERRDQLALQVNLLAEQEMTAALRMLQQLCDRQGIEPSTNEQRRVENLMAETNVYEVMQQLEQQLPSGGETEARDDKDERGPR